MQTYRCAACAGVLHFDNLRCGCGQQIALDPTREALVSLDVPCANREVIGCNWTGPPKNCLRHACAMTDVPPGTAVDESRTPRARAAMSAHLMHLADLTGCMAAALGPETATPPADAHAQTDAVALTATGMALAVNHANRSLEIPDPNPVLSDTVREKLSFTHHWLRQPLRAAQGEPA